jgi:hypothetical protein
MDGYEHTSMVFLWKEFQSWEDLCTNFERAMWTWRVSKQTKANSIPRFKVAGKSRNCLSLPTLLDIEFPLGLLSWN